MIFDIPDSFHFEIGWFTIAIVIILTFTLLRRSLSVVAKRRNPAVDALMGIGKGKHKSCGFKNADTYITKLKKGGPVVAVFDVKGIILNESHSAPPFVGAFATFGGDMGDVLEQLSKNENVKAVLVRFNTPGGTVTGSEGISRGLELCRATNKCTVAYVAELSASGGVWGMVGAEHVIAHPNALLGSVGVRGPRLMQYEGVMSVGAGVFGESVDAESIHAETLYAGKGKTLGDPYTPNDPEVVDSFRRILDRMYTRFLEHIEKSRGIAASTLRDVGAIILDAPQALELKLIDQLGTTETVKSLVATKVGTPWDECTLVHVRFSGKEKLGSILAEAFFTMFPRIRMETMRGIMSQHPVLLIGDHRYS